MHTHVSYAFLQDHNFIRVSQLKSPAYNPELVNTCFLFVHKKHLLLSCPHVCEAVTNKGSIIRVANEL